MQHLEWLTTALLLSPLTGAQPLAKDWGEQTIETRTPEKVRLVQHSIDLTEYTGSAIRVPPLCDRGCSSSRNKNRYNINLV